MSFYSKSNYKNSKKKVGYVTRNKATQSTYDSIGFMSGLEVHQQLLTEENYFVIVRQAYIIIAMILMLK